MEEVQCPLQQIETIAEGPFYSRTDIPIESITGWDQNAAPYVSNQTEAVQSQSHPIIINYPEENTLPIPDVPPPSYKESGHYPTI